MALFFEINEARKFLELEEAASKDEIEAASRKLPLKFHPDRQEPEDKPEAERRMKDINWAYRTLTDYCSRSECQCSPRGRASLSQVMHP
jgi:DnaJ-class molecular chaperone